MKVTIAGLTVELTPEQKEDLIKQLEKPDKVEPDKVEPDKREPVFKDYLGNEIFDGDGYYWVDEHFVTLDGICCFRSGKHPKRVYFKHRSDAEAYIERNKPKWSENDVTSALHSWGEVFVDNVIRNIKNYKP